MCVHDATTRADTSSAGGMKWDPMLLQLLDRGADRGNLELPEDYDASGMAGSVLTLGGMSWFQGRAGRRDRGRRAQAAHRGGTQRSPRAGEGDFRAGGGDRQPGR